MTLMHKVLLNKNVIYFRPMSRYNDTSIILGHICSHIFTILAFPHIYAYTYDGPVW